MLLCHTLGEINSKENKMKRVSVITSSVTLALALALNGCGGGGSSASDKSITIRGKAIDPYLSGSKVCLDINNNHQCEVSEPHAVTNSHGEYALDIAKEHHDAVHTLLVTGGIDTGTSAAFTGTLTAVKEAHQTAHHITPLTTAVEARYQYCQAHHAQCHDTVAKIESDLAAYLGLTKEDINGDIVALANQHHDEPLKTAQALYGAAVSHNPHNPYKAYEEVVKYGFPAGHNWQQDLQTIMPKEYGLVTAIMNIDDGVLENAGFTIGVDMAESATNVGVEAGESAANAGVEAGNAAANAGVEAGETVANAGVDAGNAAANAGVTAGETAANVGVEAGEDAVNAGLGVVNNGRTTRPTRAHMIAQYVHGLLHQLGNTAANAGVTAGESAANAGVEAGNDAANAGVEAGNDAANAGVTAGESAANAGVEAGETAANAGVDTAVTVTRPFGR